MSLSVILREGNRFEVIHGFESPEQARSFLTKTMRNALAVRFDGRYDSGNVVLAETLSVEDAAEMMFSDGLKGWQESDKSRVAAEREAARQAAMERQRQEDQRIAIERERQIRRQLLLKQQEFEASQVARWREEIETELDAGT